MSRTNGTDGANGATNGAINGATNGAHAGSTQIEPELCNFQYIDDYGLSRNERRVVLKIEGELACSHYGKYPSNHREDEAVAIDPNYKRGPDYVPGTGFHKLPFRNVQNGFSLKLPNGNVFSGRHVEPYRALEQLRDNVRSKTLSQEPEGA